MVVIMTNIYVTKDLSRLSGHSIYTIKFYLKLGLLREFGRSPQTRIRYFNDATLERLSTIRRLRKEHRSLTEIQHLLNRVPASSLPFPRPASNIQSRGGPASSVAVS